jgi:hypothetical protein
MARHPHSGANPPQRTEQSRQRTCLRCDRTFWSEGPHHRLCQTCREALATAPSAVEEHCVAARHRHRLNQSP